MVLRLLVQTLTQVISSECQVRQGNAHIAVANQARVQVHYWRADTKAVPSDRWPPERFMLHTNPPLHGKISHDILAEIDHGVGITDLKEPVATGIVTLYRDLISFAGLEARWHDMEVLIAFYGQEGIFDQANEPTDLQEYYKCSNLVLSTGAQRKSPK
jgi:hypothetical protein